MRITHHLGAGGWAGLAKVGGELDRRVDLGASRSTLRSWGFPSPQEEHRQRGVTMRFMMFMLPNISDEEWMPTPEAVQDMSKYNEELTKAGVLLALDGLHPGAAGVRVSFPGGKATVTDGPFSEAKEVIGGYW